MGIGVHLTHCCVVHGCKYGDDDCPVAEGINQQEYPCELCNGPCGDEVNETPSKYQHNRYRRKNMHLFSFEPNCRVWVTWNHVHGSGRVVGCATIEQPILGSMYIVQMDNPKKAGIDVGTYPFNTLTIPEVALIRIAEKVLDK